MKRLFCTFLILHFSFSACLAASLISITPVNRSMEQEGGTGAINTSGSGTWTASVSDDWIMIVGGTSGTAGYAVGYTVAANDGVEKRTGYVYVSGQTHTIVQAGVGATLGASSADFETAGGTGRVSVSAPSGKMWHAKSNVDWITVRSATGTGAASVSFTVARYDEVSTRSGTLTIADNTFTVRQTGRRMRLSSSGDTTDYFAATVKVRVNALADTEWGVATDADWIAIADAGNGRGGDQAAMAVAENPSYTARTGTVTIGTETFTIRQLGRTALVFRISDAEAAYGAEGATGERIAVTATPDLGWQAASDADWIEFYSGYSSGSGSGSVAYKVKPNPTLYPRTGTVTVTAEDAAVAAKRLEISQEAAVATFTMDAYEFAAAGESVAVGVNTGAIVGWNVINTNAWLSVSGLPASGPADLVLTAAANTSVKPRSGVVLIADHEFRVSQKGRGVAVGYDAQVFGTDGKTTGADAENLISVTADGDVSWTAEASDATWIVIYEGKSGTGNGTVKYIVAPYVGAGEMRTGTITIGDQVVYIAQRPYDVSIEPNGEWMDGNAGAGEVQVALDVAGVWNAIATEPWITITSGYNSGTGSGRVLFTYTDNNTGKERTGKIVIAGEVYTLTQAARQNIAIAAEVDGHGGAVEGGGVYNIGTETTLTAVPDAGYGFVAWRRGGETVATSATLPVVAATASAYTAVFAPLAPTLAISATSLKGVTLAWTNLAWAAEYRIWRGETNDRSAAAQIDTVVNDGAPSGTRADMREYLDSTGALGRDCWYWIEAVGAEDDVWGNGMRARREAQTCSVIYVNLRGTTHSNPATYKEGTEITLSAPTGRRGYTFLGWSPEKIAADATGDLTIRAVWLQNEYSVRFDLNGAEGEMADEQYTYGLWKYLSPTNFARPGYVFAGWGTAADAAGASLPLYGDSESLKNLTAELDGVVTLYAVWNALIGIEGDPAATVTGNDATGFVIRPSDGRQEVVVFMPPGFDAGKVTVEVPADVASLVANGAAFKVVKNGHDITPYLSIPSAGGTQFIASATIRPEIAREPLDPSKGAIINLTPSSPSLTTSATRPGLTYTLREGHTLGGMAPGASKIGDGQPWTPAITVKGGTSGFYSIKVEK